MSERADRGLQRQTWIEYAWSFFGSSQSSFFILFISHFFFIYLLSFFPSCFLVFFVADVPTRILGESDLDYEKKKWKFLRDRVPSLLNLEPTHSTTPGTWLLDAGSKTCSEDQKFIFANFPDDKVHAISANLNAQ